MPTGAELFASSLIKLGIQEVFTLVGDHLNDVLLAIREQNINVIDFRHESGVTHAADAWTRVRRKPALALVTGGPGHTNALTGIATAFLNGSPLIAVSGSPSAALAGRQNFQVIDQVGMTRPVVKWAADVSSASQIPYYLGRAYNEAMAGRMGPVHLSVPVDVFSQGVETSLALPAVQAQPTLAPSDAEVEQAIELLASAKNPLVVAGSGVWWGNAENELKKFIETAKIPLYTVTMARGIVPDSHPYNFGYADPAINKAVLKSFKEADVILLLGKRIDYRLALGGPRLFNPATKIIQVDIHQPELGNARPITQGICAGAKAALESLTAAAAKRTWAKDEEWFGKLGEYHKEAQATLTELSKDSSTPLHPAAVFGVLRDALPKDVLYAWDGGDFVHWGRAMVPAETPGGWLRLGPMGTIGSALPYSVAVQLANPGRPVVMITGDGSLGFYIAELETLVRYNLPVVIIVGNDGGWGLERELQREITGGETVACELQHTRYDIVMKGFGGEGELIEKLEDLAPAVQRAFAAKKPYLLNVTIRGSRSPFTQWQVQGKKK